ncbi:hypothetical protein QTP88_002960 [Uroleucon formosanum]
MPITRGNSLNKESSPIAPTSNNDIMTVLLEFKSETLSSNKVLSNTMNKQFNELKVDLQLVSKQVTELKAVNATLTNEVELLKVGSIYFPPCSPAVSYEAYAITVENLVNSYINHNFILCGDFNLPDINWSNDSHGLANNVSNAFGSLLDLIFVNNNQFNVTAVDDPLVPEDRYHPALTIDYNPVFNLLPNNVHHSFFNFHKADYLHISEFFLTFNWRDTFSNLDANLAMSTFYDALHYSVLNTNDKEVSDIFSKQFSSVYTQSRRDIHETGSSQLFYDLLSNYFFDVYHIESGLSKLCSDKSIGPDGLSGEFLYTLRSVLSYPLWLLFHKSLDEGIYPEILKLSTVIPIFKSGDPTDVVNYRPISILSHIAKLFNSLVLHSIKPSVNSMLIEEQHGFRTGRSTNTCNVVFSNYVFDAFKNSHQVDEFKLVTPIKTLYCAFVRSILEYGVVWDPYTACDRNQIERVQRKFLNYAAFTLNIDHMPHDYIPVMDRLGLSTLVDRRQTANLNFLKQLIDDHSSVLLSIDCQPLSNQYNPPPLHTNINWDNFHKSILQKTSLKVRLKTKNDIDEAVNLLTSNIQASAWESAKPSHSRISNIILLLYIRNLISLRHRARCLWQRTNYPSDKSQYNALAQKLKRIIANYRNESYTKHLESLTTKDGSLWKATKHLLRIRNPPAILRNTNGNWVHSDEDKASIFANYLAKTFQHHNSILLPEKINIVEQFLNSPLQMSLPPKHTSLLKFSTPYLNYYVKSPLMVLELCSVITRMLEVSPNATWTHCNIHREVLVSKNLPDNLKILLNTSVKIVNFIKTRPLQSRLFEKLCEEMGSSHKSFLLHTEVRWLSRGKVLTRLVELREEVPLFLKEKTDLAKSLYNEDFILKLTYLADIFSKLNELNLYLQGTQGADIFAVHEKIRGFMKKLTLWKKNIEKQNYDCFETFQTFITKNNVKVPVDVISQITLHLISLKDNFNFYFLEEMEKYQKNIWVVNPFQDAILTGISTKSDEELIDISEDTSLKLKFSRNHLIEFWLSAQQKCPTLSTEALKVFLPFSSLYLCEVGFSAMVGIKNKHRNKLQLSHSLRLKVSKINVDVGAVINNSRKQAHSSHTPNY